VLAPVERGIEDSEGDTDPDGDTGLPSVDEGELPVPEPEMV
jgi:hypothetical protein